ncbi:hypothetical protein ACIPPJ_32045 [Streptomyces sp. NPDC086091]|uniref:hypothetical protein n=1 Tax=Streptomyces sp. NPDC086091 TaxID=3365751 RepID=UPI003805036C
MPGTVLLLAASPMGRGCLVDAASVLPVLGAVPPAVLSGTDTANVVELADPLDPQAVLTRLRAAATAPGPLTVFVAGQLQLDRRQKLPHLALARTTPATVRYTGLPWHWFWEELRLRQPGTTDLLLDLRADAETWRLLDGRPLDCGAGVTAHGRIAPPARRRGLAAPTYMKAVATILRSGGRPPVEQLHLMAMERVVREGETGDLVISGAADGAGAGAGAGAVSVQVSEAGAVPVSVPAARVSGPVPPVPSSAPEPTLVGADAVEPHALISAAVRAGDHAGADALAAGQERAALAARGPGSEEALHWAEVRADLAMFAGDAERSCRTWMAVAEARLAAGQSVRAAAVEAAVDRAHHQWGRIPDPVRARGLGPDLTALRTRVPGRREGALDHVREQLRQLQTH